MHSHSKRLAWALLASLLAHLALIGDIADLPWRQSPSTFHVSPPLEAWLTPILEVEAFPAAMEQSVAPVEPPPVPRPEAVLPPPPTPEDVIAPSPARAPRDDSPPGVIESPSIPIRSEPTSESIAQRLPRSGKLVYQFYWGKSRWLAGEATHQWVIENGYYTLSSTVSTTGLFGLIHPTRLVETSQGSVIGERLRPQMFITQLNEFAPAISYFNWDKGHFRWYRGATSFTQPLPANAYDKIAFLYQLYLTPNRESFYSADITMGRRLEHYEIQDLGVDEIDIEGQVHAANHLKRATTSAAMEQVEIWLSTSDNLPLRMIYSNNAGDQFEQLIRAESIPVKSNPQSDPNDQH